MQQNPEDPNGEANSGAPLLNADLTKNVKRASNKNSLSGGRK